MAQVLRDEVVPVAERRDAVVIDGGTDSGVMQLIGRARSALGGRFPLIGVAAEGTVLVPEAGTPSPDAVETGAEPHAVPPSTRHAMGRTRRRG